MNKQKQVNFLLQSEDKTKPNTTEFPFFYSPEHKGEKTHVKPMQKIIEKMFSTPNETIPRSKRKMKVVYIKKQQKQGNYFEINRFSTV